MAGRHRQLVNCPSAIWLDLTLEAYEEWLVLIQRILPAT